MHEPTTGHLDGGARRGVTMIVTTFLHTAEQAERMLASPAVAERWERPSALEGYTVGGLAGHLARAALTVDRYLDQPVIDADPTDAAGYFVRVLGSEDPVTGELHVRIRARSDDEAADGPEALVARVHDARTALGDALTAAEPGRLVAVRDDTVLPLTSYLETRLVELVVHLDDLAVSVDQPGPTDLLPEAYEVVAAVLARVAVRRAGPLETVRSLARRERAPTAVRAL
jgi:uncharacterized protein (TIGR03083 family)